MKQRIKLKRRKTNIRPLIGAGIFTSTLLSVFLAPKPVLAVCPSDVTTAGTTITNKAAVSYGDGTNDYTQESNEVIVKVAEIAGITVTALGDQDIDTSSRNRGDVVGFDFKITNTGNDPTYFVLPGANNIGIVGGVIATAAPSGSTTGVEVLSRTNGITNGTTLVGTDIPLAGASTVGLAALPDNGLIKPGDSLTVRVYVRITESRATFPVSVRYGNTDPNDNSSATQNQLYDNTPAYVALPGVSVLADDVYTLDEESLGTGQTADGCASADDQTPANGVREAAAFYEILVGTDADPLAHAKVLKTRTDHDPGTDPDILTDDTLTYRLDLTVDNIQLDSSFKAAPLAGTLINLGTGILVSDAIPVGTRLSASPATTYTDGDGNTWNLVYTTVATSTDPLAETWIDATATAIATPANVNRIGWFLETATADISLAPGYSTVGDANGGFQFTVIASAVVGDQAQIANIAQAFGETDEDNDPATECTDCPIIYDESGDEKPNNFSDTNTPQDDPTTPTVDGTYYDPTADNGVADPITQDIDGNNNNTGTDRDPNDGGGEDNVFNLNLNPEAPSGILNGPVDSPDAVGPNSNNDDFYEKATPDGAEYDPIDFLNTVRNPGSNADDLDNVVLLPLTPSEAQTAAGHDTFGVNGDIPTGTVVTIVLDTNGGDAYTGNGTYDDTGADGDQVAVYTFDGTDWDWAGATLTNVPAGYTGVVIDKLIRDGAANSITGFYDVNYQVTIDPPGTGSGPSVPAIGDSIPVPIVAYPEDTAASGFAVADDSVFNIKIDRLFIGGFLEVKKYVRLLDASGNVLQPYTDATSIAWNPQPGQLLEYKIEYKNTGTRNTSGSGNITLTATGLVVTEDGTLDWCADTAGSEALDGSGNNWALNNTGTTAGTVSIDLDTSHVNGGVTASKGTVGYFSTNCLAAPTYTSIGGERSGTTWLTDVPVYRNTVGDLTPQDSGTFTFRRRVN